MENELGQLYKSHREELLALLKNNSSYYFECRQDVSSSSSSQSPHPFLVGLLNERSTCYLNSILQALYSDKAFCLNLFESTASHPIVNELRLLFASFYLSDHSTLTTTALTDAFGWSSDVTTEQSDIHELYCVLVDALSCIDGFQSSINMCQGTICDELECSHCQHYTHNTSDFFSITLNIPHDMRECRQRDVPEVGVKIVENKKLWRKPEESTVDKAQIESTSALSLTPSISLQHLLDMYQMPEVLDDGNLRECSRCFMKVRGIKRQRVHDWPDSLFIHLKRLIYDPAKRKKIKLDGLVFFDEHLYYKAHDNDDLLSPNDDECTSIATTTTKYSLLAVLVHTGTAVAGHYRTFVRQVNGLYVEYDNSTARVLTDEEMRELFWFRDSTCREHNFATQERKEMLRKGRGLFAYKNAYMFLYKKETAMNAFNRDLSLSIPAYLKGMIQRDNEHFNLMKRLYEYHQQIVEVTIYDHRKLEEQDVARSTDVDYLTLKLHSDLTLSHLLDLVLKSYYPEEGRQPLPEELARLRIRRYNPALGKRTTTFVGKENCSLLSLGFEHGRDIMCVERSESFEKYDESRMCINLRLWIRDENLDLSEVASFPQRQLISNVLGRIELNMNIDGNDNKNHDLDAGKTDRVADLRLSVGYLRKEIMYTMASTSLNDPVLKNYICSTLSITDENDLDEIRIPPERICIICTDACISSDGIDYSTIDTVHELERDSDDFLKEIDVSSSEIIVDLLPVGKKRIGCSKPGYSFEEIIETRSQAMTVLSKLRHMIMIHFNVPFSKIRVEQPKEESNEDFDKVHAIDDVHTESLVISRYTSLLEFKDKILSYYLSNVERFSESGYSIVDINALSLDDFYICRRDVLEYNRFRDDEKSLKDLHMKHNETVYIELREGCRVGGFLFKLVVDIGMGSSIKSRLISFGSIIVNENSKISQIKADIIDSWKERYVSLLAGVADGDLRKSKIIALNMPSSANCIRLRDSVGVLQVLRDNHIISRIVHGLTDGKKLIVQVLKEPELIAKNDLILYTRLVSFKTKIITSVLEGVVILPRKYKTKDLYIALISNFPKRFNSNENYSLSICKDLSTGPPLTIKSANNLNWIEVPFVYVEEIDMESNMTSCLDVTKDNFDTTSTSLVGLRDGSVVVFRESSDFAVAKYKRDCSDTRDPVKSFTSKRCINQRKLRIITEKSLQINTAIETKIKQEIRPIAQALVESTMSSCLTSVLTDGQKDEISERDNLNISNDDLRESVPMLPPVMHSSTQQPTNPVNVVRTLKQVGSSSSDDSNCERKKVLVPPLYADPNSVLLMGLPSMPSPDT